MTTAAQRDQDRAALGRVLGERMRGEVLGPSDPRYDDARKLYNAMIDKRPRLIARCVDTGDVIAAVRFAGEQGLEVAIRGGAHNGGGLGSVDDGLVIDLSAMRGVRVDPEARTAVAHGGCLVGDIDHATHAFGLAAPFGIIGTTGVGGLTLGGGIGHLTRKLGLSVDNLLSADVVLADGTFVQASERQNPDLFWALRGGGGNFGVVTSFTFRLSPVDMVVGGLTLFPLDRAGEILRWYRDFLPSAAWDLSGFFAFLTVPPAPPFPEHLHLEKMCAIVWCYTGPEDAADEAFRPVRALRPELDGVAPMPFTALQSAFDALYPPGDQWYWRADFVKDISDAAVEAHLEHGTRSPTWKSTMHLYPIDGAAALIGHNETPWSYRDARWAQVIVGVDPEPASAPLLRQWAVSYFDALHPHSMGGAYVNFMMNEGSERVRATYRGQYGRLAAIKQAYDPTNYFHINQNIQPSGNGSAE
jgi:FAD/FMN-containing dehydrogenase